MLTFFIFIQSYHKAKAYATLASQSATTVTKYHMLGLVLSIVIVGMAVRLVLVETAELI
jgi:hypothetical protein